MKAFKEGGYEVRTGAASKLDSKTGDMITGKALEILHKLREKKE